MTADNSSSTISKIIAVLVAVLVCCSCVLIGVAGYFFYESQGTPGSVATLFPSPILGDPIASPTPVELIRTPVELISSDTLETLLAAEVPENDPYELACRLKQICNVAKTVPGKSYQVGDIESFWILDQSTTTYNQISTQLIYVTPHTYFWAERNQNVSQSDVKQLMDTFEEKIYPTNREFFGSEWTPGVDGDEHIYVILTGAAGPNVGGLFNSTDEFNPLVQPHSNAHESFVIAPQNFFGGGAYSTLAHEFVHMIQHPTDRNDASWMTEGFADVGIFVNGYDLGGSDWLYTQDPDLQLNDWAPPSSPDFGPHYGQSSLYLIYFLDRFGVEPTKYLSTNPMDDLVSIDDTLAHFNITDPQTGKLITADDVFMDWAAALYLRDGNVDDGRYTYHNYSNAPQTGDTEAIDSCPQDLSNRSVNQYGIDYIKIQCEGSHILKLTGSTAVGLIPEQPHSGSFAFWSNKGNESDMTLTHEFDLSSVSGSVSLDYWTWYDIEKDWDYLYVEASTDGNNWTILKTPSGTDYNPSGASFGWAYTGQSINWIQENVDLSQYAGQKVQIRFEYVTDALLNGHGFMLDDVQVAAINYQSDFETDNGGWIPSGFVRVESSLPQTYRLSLITKGDTITVTPIELNIDNTVEIPLNLSRGDEAILIVTGTTRFTTIPAAYQVEIK